MEGTKKILFEPPILKKNKGRWYIEFWALLPGDVRIRRRVYGGMNTTKDLVERERRAAVLLKNWDPNKYYCYRIPKVELLKHPRGPIPDAMVKYWKDEHLTWRRFTINTYHTKMLVFFEWLNITGKLSMKIDKFSDDDAREFMTYLRDKRKVGLTTFNAYRTTLWGFFNQWRVGREKLIAWNPWDCIKTFKNTKQPRKYFNEDQKKELREYLDRHDPALSFWIGFVYHTFLRTPSDVRNMKIGWIDFNEWYIKIPREVSKTIRRIHPIPKIFQERVAHLKGLPQNYFVFSPTLEPGLHQVKYERMQQRFREILNELGYSSEYSMYSWRHTGAADLYNQFHDVYLVKEAMQHKDVGMTEGYLRTLGVFKDKRLYDRIDW